jgi:hypothetical protein
MNCEMFSVALGVTVGALEEEWLTGITINSSYGDPGKPSQSERELVYDRKAWLGS